MKRLILVRHGQTDANLRKQYQGHMNQPLNEFGLKQAQLLAKALYGRYQLEAVYCSPLKRAIQTANIIAEPFYLKPIILQGLKEIDFGKWDGLTYDEIASKYPISKWLETPHKIDIADGEKWKDFVFRTNQAFDRILKSPYESIAVVSHAGVIRAYLASLMNLSGLEIFNFSLDNASLSELSKDHELIKINLVNDVTHLPTLKNADIKLPQEAK